jgi:hypothetical protein
VTCPSYALIIHVGKHWAVKWSGQVNTPKNIKNILQTVSIKAW